MRLKMDEHRTTKQKILEMLHHLPDNINYDRAIESIYVMSSIELGLRESDAGRGNRARGVHVRAFGG
jgi:hypothetical protein